MENRIADAPTGIRTQHLANTSPDSCRNANPFGQLL
jgi:hypothetical protein